MSKDKSQNIGDRILNWQPFLPDPKDDMILELAVKGRCDKIVTYKIGDRTINKLYFW